MLLLFDGTDDSGAFSTVPVILRIFVPAFEVTVMVLLIAPGRPWVLKVAVILLVCPGTMGSLGQVGVVHPQEACTLERTMGVLPVFVNSKS